MMAVLKLNQQKKYIHSILRYSESKRPKGILEIEL